MMPKPFKIGKAEIHIWTVVLISVGLFFDFFRLLVIAYIITAIHETAHILTAKRLNVKIDGVEILPFGITMRIKNNCIINPADEIKIAFAGPLSNFLVAYLIYGYYGGEYKDYIIASSLAMGIFNMLPALPLDGGRIIRALMVKKFGHIRATTVAIRITSITSVFIILAGLYALYITGFNFSFLLIGGFLTANLTEEKKNANMIIMKDILFSRKKLAEKGVSKGDLLVAETGDSAKRVLKMLSYDRYYIISVVDNRMRVVKDITETELLEAMAIYGMNISMKKIVEL